MVAPGPGEVVAPSGPSQVRAIGPAWLASLPMPVEEQCGGRRRGIGAVAAVAAVAALAVAVAGCSSGGHSPSTTTSSGPPSATDAATIASHYLTIQLAAGDVRTLVLDLCSAATTQSQNGAVQDLERLPLTTDAQLRSTITALGKGAEAYCPDGVRASPNLLNDLYAVVAPFVAAAGTSTSSTSSSSPSNTTTATG
jgi:hypothetical protein